MASCRQKHMADALIIKCVCLIIVGPSIVIVVMVTFIVVILVVPIDSPPVCLCSHHITRNIWSPCLVYASVDIGKTY
jgi:hypothetical protein